MATKNKRRKRRRPVQDLFQQAQRSFSRRDFKQALKDAKVCYRQEPSEEHHRFFQRACLARARELNRLGLRDECRSVMETLLDLGVTEPSVERELSPLLVAAGLFDRSRAGREPLTVEADSPLLASAADHAVVRPGEASDRLPGIRQGAFAVQAALRALDAGDESDAVARLKNVGRSSPFADWKYFVRGLAAYYREDASEMRANWDRLDPTRFAARIAAPLRALADPTSARRNDSHVKSGIPQIAAEVLGGPLLTHLYDLRAHLAADRWKNVLESLRKSREALRQFDPEVVKRIVLVLYTTILRKGLYSRLAEFTSLADPLPMDPHWNRARAMMWEHPRNHDVTQAETYWLRYLDDLATPGCLPPRELPLAQALVWERIGGLYVEECRAVPGMFRRRGRDVAELRSRAAECFNNSLRLAPELLSAYEALAAAQTAWQQPEETAETNRRLLERFPDNLEALLFLARHHIARDEPLHSREYALRAHRLRPSNQEIVRLLWSAHVGSARHCALQKQWEKGRAEFEAADKLDPSAQEAYHLLARKAVFELKACNFELGEELVERAQGQAEEPAPALLVLAIEATRYDLSRPPRTSFDRQWKAALKRKCRSETAGLMCAAMRAYLIMEVGYPGRWDHVKHLVAYLRRCTRVKWRAGDLRNVCAFLDALTDRPGFSNEVLLLEKLVRKGLKKFPDDATFHVLAGELEIARGPVRCNRRYARRCFERALELAKRSNDPGMADVVERAKAKLTFLEEVELDPDYDDDEDYDDNPFAGPPPGGFFDPELDGFAHGAPGNLFSMFLEACAQMGLDPEEVLDEMATEAPFRVPGPSRRPRSKPKKKR